MTDLNAQKPTREAIGARLRYDVLRRCNFACYYCGIPASLGLKQLHVDHVVPVSLGGTAAPWNLVAACWDCNAGKANIPPTPELTKRVKEDFAAYDRPLFPGASVDICKYCDTPIAVPPGEDYEGQCSRCNEIMCRSFDVGVVMALRDPETYAQRYERVMSRGDDL